MTEDVVSKADYLLVLGSEVYSYAGIYAGDRSLEKMQQCRVDILAGTRLEGYINIYIYVYFIVIRDP